MSKSITYGCSPGPTSTLSLRFRSPCATPAERIASSVCNSFAKNASRSSRLPSCRRRDARHAGHVAREEEPGGRAIDDPEHVRKCLGVGGEQEPQRERQRQHPLAHTPIG